MHGKQTLSESLFAWLKLQKGAIHMRNSLTDAEWRLRVTQAAGRAGGAVMAG
jgi:hypothetical protein